MKYKIKVLWEQNSADTVWYEGVREALNQHKPEVIVVNGGDNQFVQGGSLIMGKEDIDEVYKAAPEAKIIVSHMKAGTIILYRGRN